MTNTTDDQTGVLILKEASDIAETAFDMAIISNASQETKTRLIMIKQEAYLNYIKSIKKSLDDTNDQAKTINKQLENATKDAKQSLSQIKMTKEIVDTIAAMVALASKLVPFLI